MKTDHQLRQDVNDELEWEPSVHAGDIDVDATNGIVTLFGDVGSSAEKARAEGAARRVHGVKALVSTLGLSRLRTALRSDDEVRRAVRTVLDWRAALSGTHIDVDVADGWVTLSGSVQWQYQRLAAFDGARRLAGVSGISNDLVVEPSLSAQTVQADIEAALQRTAVGDAAKISVHVQGHDVTLAGTVRNWAEREAAVDSVWAAPGVTGVWDHMTLSP
jgi:osmotically-inducible protein OsmY